MRLRWLPIVFAVGCSWIHPDNPDYCEGHPTDPSCISDGGGDGGSDAPTGCSSDQDCAVPTAVCVIATRTCVQCTTAEASACTGTTPICGSDDACQACTAHSQCTSDVCRPDGSCSDGSDVAYVAPTGSGTACTQVAPCGTMANALATTRPYVKVTGTIDEQPTINNQDVTVLADPGATLSEASTGVILTVTGSSQVSIYDLTITGALGSTSVGISMPPGNTATLALHRITVSNGGGVGISASGGTLTVQRSTISGNTGGGISISSGAFTLENDFITANGAATSSFGGVKIDAITTAGTHQFDFNTISANVGPATVDTGVLCGTVTVPITLDSDIVYANTVSGGGVQFGGSSNCTATYSDIGPDGSATGTDLNADPLFSNPSTGDYHLTSGSPCIDKADPAATLDIDFDGDTRPQGSGFDIGADEYHP